VATSGERTISATARRAGRCVTGARYFTLNARRGAGVSRTARDARRRVGHDIGRTNDPRRPWPRGAAGSFAARRYGGAAAIRWGEPVQREVEGERILSGYVGSAASSGCC
jgi:hypothetical protein